MSPEPEPTLPSSSETLPSLAACERALTQATARLAALEKSERQFRTLADNIPQLAWIADEHGWIFWYNQRWYDYTGTTLEEMQGWGWKAVHHPDHVERVVDRFSRHIQTGEPWEDTFPLRSKTGEYRWFLSRAVPIRDGDGATLWWFGTNTDVTEQRQFELALQESERIAEATFQQTAIGILHVDLPRFQVLRSNRAFCRMIGYSVRELKHLSIKDLVHPDDLSAYETLQRALISGRRTFYIEEMRFRRKDDDIVWGRVTSSPVCDDDGSIRHLIMLVEDITAAKLIEHELREVRTRVELATRIAQIGFWEWEPHTGRVYLSPEWKRQLGYEDHELQNSYEEFAIRLHPDDRVRVKEQHKRFFVHPWTDYSMEFRLLHKDGRYRWIWTRAQAILDERGEVTKMLGTHLDVTERKETEEKMRHLAQHDPLTGLPNRSLIYEFAHQLIASAKRNEHRLAVLFFDLDRFKPVNDTYGHEVGDQMLIEVATRLRKSVREEDVVGRLGGDEFMAMLTIRNETDVSSVSRHLLESLRQPYMIGDIQLSTSPSIGVAIYPKDGFDIDTLIRHADAAMYHAKENGRNRVEFFNPRIQQGVQRSLTTEQRLRRSMTLGEFELYYQPIVSAQGDRIDGIEALIRWLPKESGGLGPAEFIPIAETSGIITTLGDWVMREACRQHEAWRAADMPTHRIAVNVSPVQFRAKDFPARVERLIADTGIDPSCLELELTEGTIMKQAEEAAHILATLKDLGVDISLDDFGTGYSSLTYLSRLPIDKIKVDRSFVRNIERNERSLAFTKGMIDLAKSLGVPVVAEGIESSAALNLLRDRGCDLVQGYWLSKPLPAADVASWFQHYARAD